MKKTIVSLVIILLVLPIQVIAYDVELPDVELNFSPEVIKKGEEVFKTSCQICHSLKYLNYTALAQTDAMKAALGKEPPDLSLMAKARGRGANGAKYIYQLLMTYYTDKDGRVKNRSFAEHTHGDGIIAMPQPLPYILNPQNDEEKSILKESEQKARDVAAFLMYASEPTADERKSLGKYVIGYMLTLTALLYILNKKVWKDIKKRG